MKDLIKFKTVDQYLEYQPAKVSKLLTQLRETVIKAAPDAEEAISYNMPAYKQEGPLVYFAGYENHVGFYPTPSAIVEFADELSKYTTAKGTVHFEIGKPLPVTLIRKMVKFRIKENLDNAQLKRDMKKQKMK